MVRVKEMLVIWLLASIVTATQAAVPPVREGNWEVTITMEVAGTSFAMPPMTLQRTMCQTSNNLVPDTRQPGQDCKISQPVTQGDTVTWSMSCTSRQGTMDGKGKVTYQGDRYVGSLEAVMTTADNPARTLRYQYQMNGKYLGSCP